MKFLVGTHRYLIRVELDGTHLEAHAVALGFFYGMTHKPDGRHIIARREIGVFNDDYHPITPMRLQVWDADVTAPESAEGMLLRDHGTEEGSYMGMSATIPLELHDVHQIVHDGEGLYICDCIRNQLLYVFDDNNLEASTDIQFRFIEHIFYGTAMDVNHPNTITLDSEGGFAVLLHNKGYKPSEIIFGKREDDKVLYNYQNVFPLPHHGAHNLYFPNNETVVYNASADGETVIYDLHKGEIVHSVQLGGHAKGLLRLKDHYIVGVTEHSKFEDRFTARASLVLLKADDLTEVARFDMKDCGNINEIYQYA